MTPETLLLRQVHPSFMQDEKLTSQAFFPFPKDDGQLSVYDGDQISADASHAHFVNILRNQSCGVWGVACSEVEDSGLASKADPLPDFAAHALIDFGSKTEKACRIIAKKLRARAVERGCLHKAA